MARYRKVDPRIWNDSKFMGLSERAKLVFFFLLTHPHLTMLGAMRASLAGLAEELGWPTEAFREAFGEAFQKGMVKHDPKACLIWLPNFLKYNRPESPNVVKTWPEAFELLPECSLYRELFQSVKAYAEGLGQAFGKAFAEAWAKACPNQEQEQEQEQEEERHPSDEGCSSPAQGTPEDGTPSEKPPEASESQTPGRDGKGAGEEASDAGNGTGNKGGKKRPPPDCPHEAIVALYHELLPGNPRVALWDDDRRASLRARWREDPARRSLAWWRDYFARVARSDFLTGRKPGKGGPFYPDLEWLIGPRNMGKVLNGRFDNRGPNTGSAQTDRNMQTAMEWAMETRQ